MASSNDNDELTQFLSFHFPWVFSGEVDRRTEKVRRRLQRIVDEPLTYSHFNSLIHQFIPGVAKGFFAYYFLKVTDEPTCMIDEAPSPDDRNIATIPQLMWGIKRFYVDALLFFPDIRTAYETLREKTLEGLALFFKGQRFDTAEMRSRGPSMALENISPEDRYLISEIACKTYSPLPTEDEPRIFKILKNQYRTGGFKRVRIKTIVDAAIKAHSDDYQLQLALPFATEEFQDEEVMSEEQLVLKVSSVLERFRKVRPAALQNTETYLGYCGELDVYVATSMRNRQDFIDMASHCGKIFTDDRLKPFNLRYFDPTLSAAKSHEDKGLLECLMVYQAKALVYFAGHKDSWGKDSEAAMALMFGKPVIVYCPPTPDGLNRLKLFRDIHPLSRLVRRDTGVAVGALITSDIDQVIELLERTFTNRMQYEIAHDGDGYFRLKERITGSVVRLCTNSQMLHDAFKEHWNTG